MSRRIASLWLPVAAYMGAIFVLSCLPALPEPPGFRGIDKPEHFIAYGGLALLLVRALRGWRTGWRPWAVVLAAVAVGAAYGATDELHQLFVPTRRCELLDWASDLLGAATGAAIGGVFFIRKARARYRK